MNRKCAAAVLCLALCSTGVLAGQFNTTVDIGAPMPKFQNLPATDGSKLSSDALKEDVVVLVSLANHCPWVQGMDRDLVQLASDFEGKSVRVVAFAVSKREDDRLPAMKAHAVQAGYNFSYVYDDSQALGRALGATRTPEYFVFDKDRKLVYTGAIHNSPARMTSSGPKHINGEPTQFYVKDAIDATLNGSKVSTAETRAQGCTVEYES